MIKEQIENQNWTWVNPIQNVLGLEFRHPSLGDMYFFKGEFSLNVKENEIWIADKNGDYIYKDVCNSIENLKQLEKQFNIIR